MSDFSAAHATGTSPEEIADALALGLHASGHTVGFVYATSALAPTFGRLVAALRRRTRVDTWVGTAGHGICATGVEVWDRPAAVALTCRLEASQFRVVDPVATPAEAGRPSPFAAALGVVHGDPRNGSVVDIVASLGRARGAYLVGGLTSADTTFPQVAGIGISDGGVSGLLIGGRLNVAVGLTQGCSPAGPPHVVDAADGNVLARLDGQRAYDVLCEDIGIAEGADPRPWLENVHAALPAAGSTEADYLVRNLVGLDVRRGLVAIAAPVRKGDRVMFVRRDRESAVKDLDRMLSDLAARAGGRPKAALYYSCVARGPNLFTQRAHELEHIRAVLGDIPLAGFFGNGEITNDRVYGYTGVLTVFV
jgi:small ligand-binding sensory domain FIST